MLRKWPQRFLRGYKLAIGKFGSNGPGLGGNYPKGLRAACKAGRHYQCKASKCICPCHKDGIL